jgi:hypothetical protein
VAATRAIGGIVLAAVTGIPNESGLRDAFLRPDRT